jgi:hypothetical protein
LKGYSKNQELIVRLEDKIKNVERLYPELDGAEKKKNSLILGLDNLIIKLYQISPTLMITIDLCRARKES